MGKMNFLTDFTRKYLDKNDVASAFLLAAADLERLFFDKLYHEGKISLKLLDKWGLSTYIEVAHCLKLITDEDKQMLHEFRKVRNGIVHMRLVIERINTDPKKSEYVKKHVIKVLDFIDKTGVERNLKDKEEHKRDQKLHQHFDKKYGKLGF